MFVVRRVITAIGTIFPQWLHAAFPLEYTRPPSRRVLARVAGTKITQCAILPRVLGRHEGLRHRIVRAQLKPVLAVGALHERSRRGGVPATPISSEHAWSAWH
jgi:hypothetical protein